ncbi:mite allergen Der p 3-like [Trichogramma pretiosum]|uniref:mite allergen Der p 3-like n=1 Tax=Trichogramma pretiosum TaxID=7493 RepID=UPI000C71C74E|nr:mite allergen Der p 3-like [Trichogramma pretiosum]
MLKISLLGLLVGLILSIAVSDVSAKIVQRIVRGNYASPDRFLHQVSLQILNGYCTHHFCGGSIIDDLHIVTAAHCVTNNVTHKIDNKPITVVAGTQNLRDKTSGIYRDVQYIFIPKSYTSNPLGQQNADIAILRLYQPLPLDHPNIRTINLPADDSRYKAPNYPFAVMSGFGVYNQTVNRYSGKITKGGSSPYLKYSYGKINTLATGYGNQCTANEVCVAPWNPNRKGEDGGVCQGDSGGPLTDETINTLIGVASTTLTEQCGILSIYTRVSSYLDFIEAATKGGGAGTLDFEESEFVNGSTMWRYPFCE